MSTASPEMYDLARRLLASESEFDGSSAERRAPVVQVIEELRMQLVKLTGVEGFRSLLSRALVLAKAQAPFLNTVQIQADGSLVGFGELLHNQNEVAQPAGVALLAYLLELLVTFVGPALTLRLLSDKWPDVARDARDLRTEEKS